MNKFGEIKSKIEKALISSYGKDTFKTNMKTFKSKVLGDKSIAEAFYLYDELSSKKGYSADVAKEYINESFEQLNTIINKKQKEIEDLYSWVDSLLSENVENAYSDIDNVLYSKGVTKLENMVESKLRIQKTLTERTKEKTINESVNLPLSTMLKVASNTFNKEYGNISESEKEELKGLLSMSKTQISEEMSTLRETVIERLQTTLNENEDKELKEKLGETIQKIKESQNDLVNLYKLRQLNSGL